MYYRGLPATRKARLRVLITCYIYQDGQSYAAVISMHKSWSRKQFSTFLPRFIPLRIGKRAQVNKVAQELRMIEIPSGHVFLWRQSQGAWGNTWWFLKVLCRSGTCHLYTHVIGQSNTKSNSNVSDVKKSTSLPSLPSFVCLSSVFSTCFCPRELTETVSLGSHVLWNIGGRKESQVRVFNPWPPPNHVTSSLLMSQPKATASLKASFSIEFPPSKFCPTPWPHPFIFWLLTASPHLDPKFSDY